MTYDEIIAEADERYPNGLTVESKKRKLYTKEKELFRTIYRRKTATVFDIMASQMLYPLPFHPSKIMHVIVNGKRYEYEDITNDAAEPPFVYTYEHGIGLYPTPTEDVSAGIFIFHWMEPTGTDTSFDTDFPMVLVYGLCADMAEEAMDTSMVNVFVMRYNEAIESFKRANPEPELPPMRVE